MPLYAYGGGAALGSALLLLGGHPLGPDVRELRDKRRGRRVRGGLLQVPRHAPSPRQLRRPRLHPILRLIFFLCVPGRFGRSRLWPQPGEARGARVSPSFFLEAKILRVYPQECPLLVNRREDGWREPAMVCASANAPTCCTGGRVRTEPGGVHFFCTYGSSRLLSLSGGKIQRRINRTRGRTFLRRSGFCGDRSSRSTMYSRLGC